MLLVSAKRPVTRLRGMVPRWDAGPTVSRAGGHGTMLGQTKYHRGEVVCQDNRQSVCLSKYACPATP